MHDWMRRGPLEAGADELCIAALLLARAGRPHTHLLRDLSARWWRLLQHSSSLHHPPTHLCPCDGPKRPA